MEERHHHLPGMLLLRQSSNRIKQKAARPQKDPIMSDSSSGQGTIGFWGVVAIGIGGMVGGGIFAVLGLAVVLAGGATPIAFAISGFVAAVTSYSYAKLSVRYPSEGGTVTFLNKAFGSGRLTGSLNVLLWISYLVTLALYAFACGNYGATFFPPEQHTFWKHVIICAAIIGFTIINASGATFVGRAEKAIVGIKLAILMFVGVIGLWFINLQRLAPATWTKPIPLIAGGMIIFVAYEGFELIANTANDVKNPKKTLPRAYYTAVGFVILLYIIIAIVTVGNLPLAKIAAAQDYALAAAARPFLGHFGFVIIAVAALLATCSAINATLYGSARISYIIAKDGELPRQLEKTTGKNPMPLEGLIITCVLSLLIANFFHIDRISTMGSAGFLLIFAMVNLSNARLHKETGSKRWVAYLGFAVCLIALGALICQTALKAPGNLWVLVIMVGGSVLIEVVYRGITGREIRVGMKKH
ncbi:MAG: APC family permease [Candidatus Tritonobacter lacicola]|nr:APC family permease [Candidatus Tritonobacter lacicola]